MHWKILKNELPDSVLQGAFRIRTEEDDSDQWQLLSQRSTRKIYRYCPEANKPAWLVKWESLHRFKQWRRALLGQNDACQEARGAQIALDAGLPAVPCKLVAVTSRWHWPMQTLLVFDYLAGAKTLDKAIRDALNSDDTLNSLLAKTATLMAHAHCAGICHGDCSATNLLIDEDSILHIIDYTDLTRPSTPNPARFRDDISRLVRSFMEIGLGKRSVEFFFHTYLERVGTKRNERQQWIKYASDKARLCQIRRSRRAYRNCTYRNRLLERFNHRGFRVFLLKGRSRKQVEDTLQQLVEVESKRQRDTTLIVHRDRRNRKKDSDILHYWRMTNAMERAGLQTHCAVAYVCRRWPSKAEYLLCESPDNCHRVFDFLCQGAMRKKTLAAAGSFVRRLHDVKITLTRWHPKDWWVKTSETGAIGFVSGDVAAYNFLEEDRFETRFQWLNDWLLSNPDANLREKDLVVFLKAYGAGQVDRTLWRRIRFSAGKRADQLRQ